ncbi:hypothetical protein [Natrinema pallidum]|uniref:hypothetical protein n=1 Tax=Natrinema pallidum TaxID=69527 RepID=UPI0037529294
MKYLYTSPLPEAASIGERDQLGQKLAEAGILQEDGTIVESLSSEAADLSLSGQYRWGEEISTMLATELDELSDSSLPTLPLYRRGNGYSNAGYYEIANADVEPLHANDRSVWRYSLSLTFVGKKGSFYRVLEPSPYKLDREAWGNSLDRHVSAPAAARKVQWFGDDPGERSPATPIETRATAAADVDIYDLDDAPSGYGDAPSLIYAVDYADEPPCGVRVYDSRGHDAKFTTEGIRQWQTVHSTEHDIDTNPVVLSNALIRLRLDEPAGTLEAEEWDETNETWTTVGLEASQPASIDLFDVDLQSVAMARDQAQLTFAVDGSLFSLDVVLNRGNTGIQAGIPDDQSPPVPADLEEWLAPIVEDSIIDPNAAKGLISRREVSL